MDPSRRRPSNATVLATVAVMISVWGVFLKPSGASLETFKVVGEKSDCPKSGSCGILTDNSVSTSKLGAAAVIASKLKNDAVIKSKIDENAVRGFHVQGQTLNGTDIDTLQLRNVQDVFPSVFAQLDIPVPATSNDSNTNIYIGAPPGEPGNPAFKAYDSVSEKGSTVWAPCETDPGAPPPYPCLEVPETGTYLVTIKGIWEANSDGERGLAVIATPGGCGPGEFTAVFDSLVRSRVAATSLPTEGTSNKRVQMMSALVPLTAGQCVTSYVNLYDVLSDQDIELDVSLAMQ